MSPVPEQERLARAALSFLAEPADPMLGTLLQTWRPEEILNAVSSGEDPRAALLSLERDQSLEHGQSGPPARSGQMGQRDQKALDRAFGRWRARLSQVPSAARVDAWEASGLSVGSLKSARGRERGFHFVDEREHPGASGVAYR